ncbi:MAG TPA: Ig-like domain-containing protein [Acidimicrobiales bacterium]|nr:Ig-like domain-containing protein [Acidimicrobiales bacterium]
MSITAPAAGQTVSDSSPRIAGQATMQNGIIDDVTLSLSSAEGNPVPPATRIAGENRDTVAFTWSPSLAANGRYTVTVRATGTDKPADFNGQEAASTTRDFSVEAPPATPRNVKATVEDSREVVVTWSENTEPDLLFYQVQRAVGDGEWSVAGETKTTRYRDDRTAQAGGTYRYRVVAVRKGARADSGVTSQPSAAATATVPDPPPPPTTTTQPGQAPPEGGGTTSSTVPGDGPDGGSAGGSSGGSSGGTSGSGTGSGSGSGSAGSSSPGPVITKSGKVDLSGFALLDQTKAPTQKATEAPDPGFDEELPFGERPADGDESASGEDGAAESRIPIEDASDRRQLFTFVAAGFLAIVLLMHMMWLKGEVDRPALEALPPEPVRPRQPGRLKAAGRD